MTKNIDFGKTQDLGDRLNPHHGRFFNGIKEILVPTDLTVESRKTIKYAITFALLSGAHLTLLHAYEQPYNLSYLRGGYVYDAIEEHRKDRERLLQVLGEETRKEYANCSTAFRRGRHCEEIVKAVKDLQTDLMIMGTHGDKYFQRIAYGSDTKAIVRRASCPVLVLREHDKHLGNLN